MTTSAVVVFADSSLGGTARAALTAARAWVRQGYDVSFLPLRPLHPARYDEFAEVGKLLHLDELDPLRPPTIVHFHHGAWSGSMRKEAEELIDAVKALGWRTPLLTNNVFAVDDTPLRSWPGSRTVGTLGRWAAFQYKLCALPVTRAKTVIVPNAQDTEFFRPPSADERTTARKRLGFSPDEHVILRTGSPLRSKWTDSYIRLAGRLRQRQRLVIVGAPSALTERVSAVSGVTVVAPISDDEVLRDYYWSADVFAHDALRGESFGNVILEALLTGLPVIYRAKPTRDNTPWEFRDIQGFSYVRTTSKWLTECTQRRDRYVAVGDVANRYGLDATASLLENAAGFATGESSEPHTRGPGLFNVLTILFRHNWVATAIKQVRLRRH